jgi:hypothetical protein
VPVYGALGAILFGITLGLITSRLQLAYSPNVFVDKKKRETVPEVAIPDWSLQEADRFIDKSIFRKVAHLQDFDQIRANIPDPTRNFAKTSYVFFSHLHIFYYSIISTSNFIPVPGF